MSKSATFVILNQTGQPEVVVEGDLDTACVVIARLAREAFEAGSADSFRICHRLVVSK